MNAEDERLALREEVILRNLVRLRERWRAVVWSLGTVWQLPPDAAWEGSAVREDRCRRVCDALDHAQAGARDLPVNPYAALRDSARREHARRVLVEIGDLAERAAVVEREARNRRGYVYACD